MSSARNIEDIYPLSPMQQGMLFHSLYAPETGNYYEQVSCTFQGELDVEAFRRAWQQVIHRHPVLRSGFIWEEVEEPLQVVLRQVDTPLEVEDWSALPIGEANARFQAYLVAKRSQGFDLAEAPLVHLGLFKIADSIDIQEPGHSNQRTPQHYFALGHHHLLFDGWSTPLLLREFFTLLEAYSRNQEIYLPPARPFREYIAWLKAQDLVKAEAYWRRTLAGFDEPTSFNLAAPGPRGRDTAREKPATPRTTESQAPTAQSFKEHANLSLPASEALRQLAQSEGLTLNSLVQGAWAVLLSRYSSKQDVLFGATVSGRPPALPGAEQMVGLFINTLPVRCKVDPNKPLLTWLRELQLSQLEQREYEYSPLVQIQEWSELGRDTGSRAAALFESILVFENYPVSEAAVLGGERGSTSPAGLSRGSRLQIRDLAHFSRTNYPLTLVAAPGKELGFIISYDPARFTQIQIQRILEHLCNLLTAMAHSPQRTLGELEMLSVEEKHRLLTRFNQPGVEAQVVEANCLHDLFEAQVFRSPEALALRDLGRIARRSSLPKEFSPTHENNPIRELTYAELDARANQLANYLVAQGVRPGVLVAVSLERSLEMIVAVLAVLKAGGAYLPLDPNYPRERLKLMLDDSQAGFLLTMENLTRDLDLMPAGEAEHQKHQDGEIRVFFMDLLKTEVESQSISKPNVEINRNDLAYVIYTSGSTGQPKGVMVEHHSVVNHIAHIARVLEAHPGGRMLQLISLSFDPAVEEIFSTLSFGGTLVLAGPTNELTGKDLLDLCSREQLYAIHAPTAVWNQLVDEMEAEHLELPDCVQIVTLGGEGLPVENVRRWEKMLAGRQGGLPRMVNLYGPTETTIVAAFYRFRGLTPVDEGSSIMPIGRPQANARLYVIDGQKRLSPQGVAGELAIGGAGVARGYLHRPELTARRFLPDPFSTSLELEERLYLTGDRVRWREDGILEFLGRLDDQVKLRGYRIELGEIEQVLAKHPEVRQALVLVREHRLVAYVVAPGLSQADGQALPAAEYLSQSELAAAQHAQLEETRKQGSSLLTGYVSQRLPGFMLPAQIILLDSFPVTPGGKIDREALLAIEYDADLVTRPETKTAADGIASALEEILSGIWCDVLGAPRVEQGDNFFEMGGHSLLATQLVARLRQTLNVDLPLRDLFESPTFAALLAGVQRAQAAGSLSGMPGEPILPVKRSIPGELASDPAVGLPLSFAQQRLWFLDQLEPGNLSYNILTAVRLTGRLDVAALADSLNAVIQRHEALRTRFETRAGKAVQIIDPHLHLELPISDISHLLEEQREVEARLLAREEARQPFNLAQGPLLRVRLLRLNQEEHIAILVVHHIVTDGWSMGILVRELAAHYRAATSEQKAGHLAELPPLAVQYADYAAWQRDWLQGERLEQQLGYWKQQLAGLPALLTLPTDRPRPAVKTANGNVVSFAVPQDLLSSLREVCRKQGVTLFMALLAGFQTLLFRYSGQDDLAVGSAIAGRSRSELENLIGFFVNTLVLRGDLSGDPSYAELLERTRQICLGAYAHQDVPFEMLVDALQPERNLSYTPLFQVGFDMQRQPVGSLEMPGLLLGHVPAHTNSAAFDLLLSLTENGEMLVGSLEYNTDLFDESTVRRILAHYQTVLEHMVGDIDQEITGFSLLSAEESRRLLVDWNATRHATPLAHTIHALFSDRAAKNPDALAVEWIGPGDTPGEPAAVRQLTYARLDQRANQVARTLRRMGVGPGSLVGLAAGRSLEMVVGILGILKAGGAYLPLDPTYPPERLAFMLADAAQTQARGARVRPGEGSANHPGAAMVVLTQEALRKVLPFERWQASLAPADGAQISGIQILTLDNDWPLIALAEESMPDQNTGPGDLAYVIYTSGSTGKPKGTLLCHRGLCNLSAWQRDTFDIRPGGAAQPGSRILQFSALSFDAAVWETFMALANGATLVMAPQEILAVPASLAQLMRQAAITHVTLPPTMLRVLPAEELPDLSVVVAAGEACGADLVAKWAPGREFYNAYGPTETTVCASVYRCDPQEASAPPIGRPIYNTRLYVLDPRGQPVPLGVPGELYIGGVGVARGYLNRPELTVEKFIPDRFAAQHAVPGTPAEIEPRLYRSGDLVRLRAAGTGSQDFGAQGKDGQENTDYVLEFVGRIDQQVKVRGFRIELGEIESALLNQPGIQEAVVIVVTPERPDPSQGSTEASDNKLAAYLVLRENLATETTLQVSELRQALRQTLPEYMLPSAFVILPELPMLPNGKVNRKALPAPDSERPALGHAYVPPRDTTEELLCRLCEELLGLKQVGVHDNFFELGGHSLLATQFISRVHENLGVEVPLRLLFEYPSVAGFAKALSDLQNVPGTVGDSRSGDEQGVKTPSAQAPAVTTIARSARRMKRTDLDNA